MEETQEGIITEYAGFWMRLGAYLIDGIVLSFISWIFYTIWALGFGLGGLMFNQVGWMNGTVSTAFWSLGSIISFLIGVAYSVCFWVWRGQTPGKMALGIKVIRTDGSNVNWGVAFLRYLGYIVSTIILLIGFIWIAFDRRKQGIHDKIADTYVIKLPRKRPILPETYG